MDIITNAINNILFHIDDTILNDAFSDPRRNYGRRMQSLESLITEQVIYMKVKPDLDNIGGVSIQLDLQGIKYDQLEDYSRVYYIPNKLTQGRVISQASRVSLAALHKINHDFGHSSSNMMRMNTMERSTQSIITSNSPIANMANANVEVLSDNMIKLSDYQSFTSPIWLECLLSYDDSLSEIQRPYYQDFAELVLLATKAFISRKLRLRLDKTRLDGGRDFNEYKNIVDEYRDAGESYTIMLNEKFGKILLLNDHGRRQKMIARSGKLRV